MGEVDISNLKVSEVRSLVETEQELGVTKGRVQQLMRSGELDYGLRGSVKLVPEAEIQRRKKENPGPGNPNFGKGYSRWNDRDE